MQEPGTPRTMTFPRVTAQDWRAQVDKELGGAPFDKVLVQKTPEGLSIAPLYTDRPPAEPVRAPGRFRICVRLDAGAPAQAIADEVKGGAEALWLDAASAESALTAGEPPNLADTTLVLRCEGESPLATLERLASRLPSDAVFALSLDPFADLARGRLAASNVGEARAAMVRVARSVEARWPQASIAVASALPYHDAGADAADEIALALATGAAYLDWLVDGGVSPAAAGRLVTLRAAVGRDTFGEMCKLRALRRTWRKVLIAAGAGEVEQPTVHAVCSSRTMAQRDPWVNMLRTTAEVFAAVLGGADWVTPTAFDEGLGPASPLGRRVARNTCLVLREESALGKVQDAAGGSYYFESVTDALAREAWKRFQDIEREGGIESALTSGRTRAKLDAAWTDWLGRVVTRKAPILGVSEFANLDEKLPRAPREDDHPPKGDATLPLRRDAEAFETLRLRAEQGAAHPEALLVTLGPLAESRARAGFAVNFFGAGGIRTRETATDERAVIACLCGSDERYAAEAVQRARALKAAGCSRVFLAGRPGALEGALREAGVDGFIYAGCDAVAVLSELLGAFP